MSAGVTLEGSIFGAPINGRDKVWSAIQAAGVTDTLRFTQESQADHRSYLEWEPEAVGNHIDGVTVIGFDGSGLIDGVVFSDRPLAGVLPDGLKQSRSVLLEEHVGPERVAEPQPISAEKAGEDRILPPIPSGPWTLCDSTGVPGATPPPMRHALGKICRYQVKRSSPWPFLLSSSFRRAVRCPFQQLSDIDGA